jgi:GMP reductase
MPRIEQGTKLDFGDVLIRPKRSTLKSRSDVSLQREFTFRNSKRTFSGVPVVVVSARSVPLPGITN